MPTRLKLLAGTTLAAIAVQLLLGQWLLLLVSAALLIAILEARGAVHADLRSVASLAIVGSGALALLEIHTFLTDPHSRTFMIAAAAVVTLLATCLYRRWLEQVDVVLWMTQPRDVSPPAQVHALPSEGHRRRVRRAS